MTCIHTVSLCDYFVPFCTVQPNMRSQMGSKYEKLWRNMEKKNYNKKNYIYIVQTKVFNWHRTESMIRDKH